MATSTIRGLILAVAVGLGALLIANAFTGNPSQAVTPRPGVHVSPTPTPTLTPTPTPTPKSKTKGVRIQVLNGTSSVGLASEQAHRLKAAGYKIVAVSNAAAYNTTTIFYRPGAKALALYMKQRFYPKADVKPTPSSIHADVQLTVIVGADLNAKSSPSPSSSPST